MLAFDRNKGPQGTCADAPAAGGKAGPSRDLRRNSRVQHPVNRPRRLRQSAPLRRLVRETRARVASFVQPLFVVAGTSVREEIEAMPGNFHLSVELAVEEARSLRDAGVEATLLFGLPEKKDARGSEAANPEGPVQRAVRAIKDACPELLVITDVCLCAYTDHGHCGIVDGERVLNDPTLEALAGMAVSHARAGADIVAPSDMMDGRIGAVRKALDEEGLEDTCIMSYAAKYASAFYGPFREAADSAPRFGDRRSYQMDPANADEALREVAMDIDEGADIVMVKPALSYLDVIRAVKERFRFPTAAYVVSGTYSKVKAAAGKGWIDEEALAREILTSVARAGADIIITYWAREAKKWFA